MASVLRLDTIQTPAGNNVATFESSGTIQSLTTNSISINNTLNIPTWADVDSRPTSNLSIGQMGFNIADNQIEIYNGVSAQGDPLWITYSGAASGASFFPPSYQALIDSFVGTKYYVDPTGSNSNAGSEASPWQTPNYALSTAPTGSMVIINPGTYTLSSVMFTDSSFTAKVYYDYGKNLKVVCAPGQVKIIGPSTDPGTRDYNHIIQTNSSSHVYGLILYRNNNGRTNTYSNAIFGYPTPAANVGDATNCFFRETNGQWTLHYDNPSDHTWIATNCSFAGSWGGSNYSGGGSTTCTNCAGSGAWTSSGTNTSPLTNATFNSNFSTSSTTQGVYGGTYAWDAALVTQTL